MNGRGERREARGEQDGRKHRAELKFRPYMIGLLLVLVAGCANQGSLVGPGTPSAVVDVAFTMAGPIDNTSWYYVAFDTVNDNGATFPVPVGGGPYWGNGWGTGTITHYLEYHMGQYNLFRTQLNTALSGNTGGFTGIAGTVTGSTAGQFKLTVLSVAGTTATVQSVFTPARIGRTITLTGPVESNSSAITTVVPGLTLVTGTLAVGDAATLDVELSPNAVLITPAYFTYTAPNGGTQLQASFDLGALGTNLTNVSFNFITTTQKIFDPSQLTPAGWAYDGLGPIGNDAVVRNDPRQFLTFLNSQSFTPESSGDVQGSPTTITPTQRNAIDIVDWALTVRRLQ